MTRPTDCGYLAARTVDVPSLLTAIVETVGSDRVDLVDLSRASALLRYRAARDRVVVFSRSRDFGVLPPRRDRFLVRRGPAAAAGICRSGRASMSPFDRDVLAERTMAVDRHLRRVADRLLATPGELQPSTDVEDKMRERAAHVPIEFVTYRTIAERCPLFSDDAL